MCCSQCVAKEELGRASTVCMRVACIFTRLPVSLEIFVLNNKNRGYSRVSFFSDVPLSFLRFRCLSFSYTSFAPFKLGVVLSGSVTHKLQLSLHL